MADPVDRPTPVRPGEELDLEALGAFLADQGIVGDVEVRQFPAGYSNLTYLLEIDGQELVLRRPPVGSEVATAHDMLREHRVLTGLARVWDKAPEPVAACEDPALLGAPFYLMERVVGVILRREPPPGVGLDEATARGLSDAFVEALVELHDVDVEEAGLEGFGRPEGYVRRQVEGWIRRWTRAWRDGAPDLDPLCEWLDDHRPPSRPGVVVHNDYKLDNLVLDPEDLASIRAVLDWEMATVGDPLLDLGTALGYWVEADDSDPLLAFRFGPTTAPGMARRREIADRYRELSGRRFGDELVFAYCFGLFKIIVIAQQIWVRYEQGLTTDERFAALPAAVRALSDAAYGVSRSGSV